MANDTYNDNKDMENSVTPKQLKRSTNAEESYSYITACDIDTDETLSVGYMHYQGIPHLAGTIAAILSNRGMLEKYWHKPMKVTIRQNGKICTTALKIRGYHY